MISSSTFNFKISAESISETDDIISGGIYYIRNVNSERYFDVADALTVDGTNVQQYAYNPNAKCQKWVITYIGNGDYTIKDYNSNNLLSIVASYSTPETNAWIWHNDGTNGQKFNIRKNSDGTYSFLSKCSNYSMALEVDTTYNNGMTNNCNIRQNYDKNTNNQKFVLEKVQATLIGVTDSGHDHTSYIDKISPYLLEMDYIEVHDYVNPGASSMVQLTQNTKIFISRSHGGIHNNTYPYILLGDGQAFGTEGILSLPLNTYKGVDLMAFVACFTGYGGEKTDNMATAVVARGATSAIAFEKSISCNAANTWTIEFVNQLNKGKTVDNAASKAASHAKLTHLLSGSTNIDSYFVVGNDNLILK